MIVFSITSQKFPTDTFRWFSGESRVFFEVEMGRIFEISVTFPLDTSTS